MCHPDAANTHPETYPKYQVQLQRVALLRDMRTRSRARPWIQTMKGYVPWRPTSSRSEKACRWITASTDWCCLPLMNLEEKAEEHLSLGERQAAAPGSFCITPAILPVLDYYDAFSRIFALFQVIMSPAGSSRITTLPTP